MLTHLRSKSPRMALSSEESQRVASFPLCRSLRRFPITFPPGRDPNSRLNTDSNSRIAARCSESGRRRRRRFVSRRRRPPRPRPPPPPFAFALCVRREWESRKRAVLCNVLKDATFPDQESRNMKWQEMHAFCKLRMT